MQFTNLLNRPEMFPIVAKWYYEEWGRLNSESSYEKILENVRSQSNRERAPLHLLATINGECIGVAQLKFQENKRYPKDSYWLGGVFVAPEFRGIGCGPALVGEIVTVAKSLGAKQIYLQTEKLDGGFYVDCGFHHVERDIYHGLNVAIMMMPLA